MDLEIMEVDLIKKGSLRRVSYHLKFRDDQRMICGRFYPSRPAGPLSQWGTFQKQPSCASCRRAYNKRLKLADLAQKAVKAVLQREATQ